MEDKLRLELNEYLFYEFGCDLDQAPPPISVSSPFALTFAGVIDVASPPAIVFEFASDGESFFAVAGDSLDFFPTAGMQLNDLADQFLGATWIGAREPIDSNTSAIGNERVPSTVERRQRLQELAEHHLGLGATVLEGLFLAKTGELLALVGREDHVLAVGSSLLPATAGFPSASSWRRLAAAVGRGLRNQG
jgi:hypothetical protein